MAYTFGLNLTAQEEQKCKKELRAKHKQQKQLQRDTLRAIQEGWANNKTFVIEATQVFGKKGQMLQLTPSSNFVYVNGDQAILQLSFNGLVGWNGIGGITVKEKINNYKNDSENNNKPICIQMSIQASEGFKDVSIWIYSSGSGEAQITDVKSNRIRFTGDIVRLEESRVFIGNTRF